MVQATKFLLRWLYLNNLIRDRAEIQLLPHIQHPGWHPQQTDKTTSIESESHTSAHSQDYGGAGGDNYNPPPPPHHDHYSKQHHHSSSPQYHHTNHPPPPQSTRSNHPHPPSHRAASKANYNKEEEWKRKALHAIALYPPGSPRLLALDSLRLEIVHEFARELKMADSMIQEEHKLIQKRQRTKELVNLPSSSMEGADVNHLEELGENGLIVRDGEDNFKEKEGEDGKESKSIMKHDTDIIKAFEKATSCNILQERDTSNEATSTAPLPSSTMPSNNDLKEDIITHAQKLRDAIALQRETRQYLLQLVSTILHSPPPLTTHPYAAPTNHLDPLAAIRKLLISRCIQDPNLGIELCWLLEAEVGRAWKSLFEHKQQTGRRLIVVLPAEKAAVIAKIGIEKRSAFDLLQDVESATAYGMYGEEEYGQSEAANYLYSGDHRQTQSDGASVNRDFYGASRLPASLSLKRCSHFGDTMHFIDLLTKLSLDLRMVPILNRKTYLRDSLSELNRRLRRRMATKGGVSLDVQDNCGPYDWPTLNDISLEMISYSVHLPLEPRTVVWPGGHQDCPTQSPGDILLESDTGVMRVLNIVSDKCRLLASRERCPFLVHCEIAETGLEGSDARLYASGTRGIGVTLQEVLGMASSKKDQTRKDGGGFTSYQIPTELLVEEENDSTYTNRCKIDTKSGNERIGAGLSERALPRGGYQGSDSRFFSPSHENNYSPYDMVREEQLQQLHEQLQSQEQDSYNYGPQPIIEREPISEVDTPVHTTYTTLLDRVFGLPWSEVCEQIRQTSPYGKVKGWRLASFIMKAGEDIRREALVMQVISKLKSWFDSDIPEHNRPYLRPYSIMCVGGDAGLLECVQDSKSIDEVKKETDGFTTLRDYFERAYGPPSNIGRNPMASPSQADTSKQGYLTGVPISFEKAQDNFLRSLVGNCLVCYILQIKDRHNANILLDREGHLMHIDFGFVLGDTPKMGKVPLFSERAPFKLTAEFWDVIGGWNFNQGGLGVRFCKMFEEAFACASLHADEIITLIEAGILNLTQNPNEARLLADGVRARLRMRGPRDSVEQKSFIMDLVNTALTSWGTSTYDWLQKSMNGYI